MRAGEEGKQNLANGIRIRKVIFYLPVEQRVNVNIFTLLFLQQEATLRSEFLIV